MFIDSFPTKSGYLVDFKPSIKISQTWGPWGPWGPRNWRSSQLDRPWQVLAPKKSELYIYQTYHTKGAGAGRPPREVNIFNPKVPCERFDESDASLLDMNLLDSPRNPSIWDLQRTLNQLVTLKKSSLGSLFMAQYQVIPSILHGRYTPRIDGKFKDLVTSMTINR